MAEGTRATWSRSEATVPLVLVAAAAAAWVVTIRLSASMGPSMTTSMSGEANRGMGSGMNAMSGVTFAGFVVAWVLMMAAMMFPAVVPVVRLYSRAAALGRVAPTGAFVAGYLLVWSAIALPAYVAWRALRGPLASGAHWSGYLAGGLLLAAGAYQLSPMKQACLRHCRTPMSVFLRQRRDLRRPVNALLAGGSHGLVCLGCCWAFMAVLIAFGTMTLTWMLVIAAAIFAEKVLPGGRRIAFGFAAALAGLGIALVTYPSLITSWS